MKKFPRPSQPWCLNQNNLDGDTVKSAAPNYGSTLTPSLSHPEWERVPEGRVRVCLNLRCFDLAILLLLLTSSLFTSCGRDPGPSASSQIDPNLATNGAIEVTAKLLEVPEGAIFKRDLYDYATVLKYEVAQVHRGQVQGNIIYVGHYNPFKPRGEAADGRVKGIGGNLQSFQAGQVHRMALEASIEDHFMGGIVNKYFGQATGPIYWAVWTNLADE